MFGRGERFQPSRNRTKSYSDVEHMGIFLWRGGQLMSEKKEEKRGYHLLFSYAWMARGRNSGIRMAGEVCSMSVCPWKGRVPFERSDFLFNFRQKGQPSFSRSLRLWSRRVLIASYDGEKRRYSPTVIILSGPTLWYSSEDFRRDPFWRYNERI